VEGFYEGLKTFSSLFIKPVKPFKISIKARQPVKKDIQLIIIADSKAAPISAIPEKIFIKLYNIFFILILGS